jgi:hypothetical protein
VELDLGLRGKLAELVGAEPVEGRPRDKEASDLAQRCVQRKALDIFLDMS